MGASRYASSPVRREKLTVTVPDTGWSEPQRAVLGAGGSLTRSVLRAPAGSTITEVNLLVWMGPPELPSGFDPSTVPQEDRVLDRRGVAVVGHAVDADDDFYLGSVGPDSPFDTPFGHSSLWCAIQRVAGTEQAGVVWALTAREGV